MRNIKTDIKIDNNTDDDNTVNIIKNINKSLIKQESFKQSLKTLFFKAIHSLP